MSATRPISRCARTVALLCLLGTLAGCTWQGYAIGRGVRWVTGSRTQVHTIIPVASTLRTYRVIETHWLENLMPGRVPADLERGLNDDLAMQLRQLAWAPSIVRVDPDLPTDGSAAPAAAPAQPTLVFEGFVDDYDPGYVGLRLAELGFNHVVITVRIQVRDKATGQILGAASITAQDDRVTATARRAAGRLAQRVRAFLGASDAK